MRIGPSFPHGAFDLLDCQRNRLTTGHVAGLNAAKIIFNLPAQKSVQAHASLAAVCRDSPPPPPRQGTAGSTPTCGLARVLSYYHLRNMFGAGTDASSSNETDFFPAKQLRTCPLWGKAGMGARTVLAAVLHWPPPLPSPMRGASNTGTAQLLLLPLSGAA